MKLIYVTSGCLFLCVSFGKSAQGSERWPLPKILQRSVETSPAIRGSQYEVVADENQALQAGRWDNPDVSTTLGQKTSGTAKGRALQISILQSIPLFGQKGAAEKVGREQLAVSQVEYGIQRLVTEHSAGRQAFKLASMDEQVKHIGHRRERILAVERYLQSRPFASPSQAVEKNLIQNRLREIEEKFVAVTSNREREWQALNVFLGLSEPIEVEVSWAANPSVPDLASLKEKSEKENPSIVRQSKVILVTEAEISRAVKKAYPEIRIGGGYGEEVADQTEKTYFGALQLTIPIFDAGTYGVRAAGARRDAESSRLEQRRREVNGQFHQALAELNQSKNRMEIFPLTLIPRLEAQMEKAEQNWRKGLVPVTAFLELENQVHDQIIKVFEVQIAYVEALSQLFLLSGQSFPQEGK